MIVTFYSYKGGVGRSMALANVGQWLRQQGLRVLLVDWDLEAPGLENYFALEPQEAESIRGRVGVIDLLHSYLEQAANLGILSGTSSSAEVLAVLQRHLPPVSTYAVGLGDPGTGPGSLSLLSAGLRADFARYAESVQNFRWDDLYTRCHGEEFFEWFRVSADGAYDVVLVDSRTGVTEMGSVCTRQLADIVVSFCAPNISNLHGVVSMAQSFIRDELMAARGRPLQNVIVPARVEMSEQAERSRFRDTFATSTEPFLPPAFRDNDLTFWGLRVPYVPFHAYREALTIGTSQSIEELAEAYKNLTAALVLLAPEDSPVYERCRSELSRVLPLRKALSTAGASALEDVARRQLQQIFESVPADRQSAVLDAMSRFLWIDPATGDITQRRVASQDLEATLAELQPFLDAGVFRTARDGGGVESMGTSEPLDLTLWRPLRDWAGVPANREFVLWRQALQQLTHEWERSGRDDGALIRGTVLTRAARHLEERPQSLSAAEQEFVHRGRQSQAQAVEYENRRRARARTYRRIVAASFVVGALGLGAWYARARTVGYTMRAMHDEGAAVLSQASAGAVEAWAKALVLAGEDRNAFEAARSISEPSERALALASVAEALALAKSAPQANAAADEAIAVALTVKSPTPVLAAIAERLADNLIRDRAVRAAKLAIERHDHDGHSDLDTTLSWGRVLLLAGKPQAAYASARAAVDQARTKASPLERLNALTSLAGFAWDEADEPAYLAALRDAASEFADPLERAYAWADVAAAMFAISATSAADTAANEAHGALMRVDPQQGHRFVWLSQIAERLNDSGQKGPAVIMARDALKSVPHVPAIEQAGNGAAASKESQELEVEAVIRAASVLALNGRFAEAERAVESLPLPTSRATAWVSIAEQLKDPAKREDGINAALMAAEAAGSASGADRSTLLLRAAGVLAHLNRPDDARRLLQGIPTAVDRTTGKGATRSLAADLAEVWATVGEYQHARILAGQASEADRLRPLAAILFEYSRRRDPHLASWLDPKRSSSE